MKKTKKIIIILIILLVIVAIVIYFREKGKTITEYSTIQVACQDLSQTVSATGSIKSAEEIDLNFAAAGRISVIYVKVGERVTRGKVLAQLDSSDLAVQLKQYQATLASAQANLDKILAGATTEEINVSQEEVDSAYVAYQAALTDLENARKNKEENMNIYKETALNDLDNYLFKARAALDVVLNTYNDPAGKDYLSIKNPQYLINTKVQRDDALVMLINSEEKINQAKLTRDYDDILFALDDSDLSLDQVVLTLDSMFNALLNSLTTTSFPESSLETLKTNIKTEQTTINTGISTLQTDKSNLQTKKLSYDNAIDTAESTVEQQEQAWNLAKARYDLTVADPKISDVAYYQALVEQAQAQVSSVQQKMSDRVITAPVFGVVTKVNNSVGEYSSLATPVIVMLGDQKFEIEVDVPESDIAKVSVGDKASITLDAFGDDIEFSGKIVLIEPAETEISGVVYYKVKVNLDETEYDVKPGMTANVDFMTDFRSNVLVIPQRAVANGKVQVLTNRELNTTEERAVVIGLKGDEGLVEIISGLEEGEEVVTFTKNGKK